MKGFTKIFLLTLFLITSFSSCKKEEVEDIPSVVFIKPTENQSFIVGDTLPVVFDVSSISSIKSIDISLVDMNHTPVSDNYSYSLLNGKTSGRVNFALILDDRFLAAGEYYVLAKVTNEKDTKNKFQKVNISTYDRKLLGLSVITKLPNSINIWNYDVNFQQTLKYSMQGDYSGSAYMSFHNRMSIAAKIIGDFTIWDYVFGDTVVQIPSLPNPPAPTFTGTDVVNDKIALLYYDGKSEFYNYSGKLIYTIQATQGYFPIRFFDTGYNFISVEKEKAGYYLRLVTHLANTGFPHSYYVLAGPVIAAFPFEVDDFMMFSNYGGTGQIEKFIWSKNATTRPMPYSGDPFVDVVQINKDEYLILTEHDILKYRYSVSSITTLSTYTFADPLRIAFDPLTKTVWVADKHGFSLYNYSDGNYITDKRISEEVVNFHLIYNR